MAAATHESRQTRQATARAPVRIINTSNRVANQRRRTSYVFFRIFLSDCGLRDHRVRGQLPPTAIGDSHERIIATKSSSAPQRNPAKAFLETDYFVRRQRASAALRAISRRRFALSRAARAGPPFSPPRRPSAAAWTFFAALSTSCSVSIRV